MSVFERLRK
jgi:hypothetical protein